MQRPGFVIDFGPQLPTGEHRCECPSRGEKPFDLVEVVFVDGATDLDRQPTLGAALRPASSGPVLHDVVVVAAGMGD